jgi:uncharacterized Fe-S cluster protein YjdI
MKPSGRTYRGEGVEVTYDAKRCLHAAECVRGLPEVFDPQKRPWIQPEEADADKIAEVVRRCPTGALHYALASGAEEVGDEATNVAPQSDGPLFVKGTLRIETPDGTLEETRVALCRCGQSGNKPFCDNTHKKVGWKDSSS